MNGIHACVPRKAMSPGAKKMRDFYEHKPDAGIYQKEFGYYVLDRWKREGYIKETCTQEELDALFGFDPPGRFNLGGLGGCEAAFCPPFEVKVLEDRGEHEVVQDWAGRHVLYFKNRRDGFMPEYLDHPVKDEKTWEENCLWRMDPAAPARYESLSADMAKAQQAAGEGQVLCQTMVGGYMYLRSLMGPLGLLYMFYDNPNLVHSCMRAWFDLADAVIAKHQEFVTLDSLAFDEDICYNHGSLISQDMIREFLFPYYQQLIQNTKRRQLDPSRRLHVELDTDGRSDDVIDLYAGIGMDLLAPFEAASGCDVVRTGREHPDLLISGGFDKRILAHSKEAIDREVERIMPAMKRRGGYIPTCDHGVPEEVSFENYLHYRKRMLEYA